MKKILFLLLIVATAASAGVKNATTLCIEDKSGAVLKFLLQDRPKIQFRGNYTVVQSTETKLLQFKNLAKAYFLSEDDDPLAVSDVAQDGEQVSAQGDVIALAGFKPLTNVLVYTTGGTLVQKAQVDVSGSLSLSLGGLPTGVYVVKAGKMVFKMAR